VGFTILSDKHLAEHPNKIIAYTCLCDAFNYFQYASRHVTCGFNYVEWLSKFFAVTVQQPINYLLRWPLFELDPYFLGCFSRFGVFPTTSSIQVMSFYAIVKTVNYMSLFLNTVIILDLYMVIKNPFTKSDSRVKKALTWAIFLACVASALNAFLSAESR